MNEFEKGLSRYLDSKELKTIERIKVGIGGAGGLGSNIATMLVRSGFKNIEIIDHDTIEAANLNRQQYFLEDIGKNKVDTLKQYLLKINPGIKITAHNGKWSKDSAENILKSCDIIFEAFDEAATKKSFVEYYQDKTTHIISGNGMAGLTTNLPITVNRINNIFIVGDNTSDITDGIPPMAPRVTQCASIMTELALKLALNNIR